MALGMEKVHPELASKIVAVIGDSTFFHSGMTGLVDQVYNGGTNTILLLDNSITAMTGHQHNPTTGFDAKGNPATAIDMVALCKACGIEKVLVADPFDLSAFEAAVKEALNFDGPAVVISKRPCILLDKKSKFVPLAVDKDTCTGCKICLRVGCPALGAKTDADGKIKAFIDKAQCTACGMCAQACPHKAIDGAGAKEEK